MKMAADALVLSWWGGIKEGLRNQIGGASIFIWFPFFPNKAKCDKEFDRDYIIFLSIGFILRVKYWNFLLCHGITVTWNKNPILSHLHMVYLHKKRLDLKIVVRFFLVIFIFRKYFFVVISSSLKNPSVWELVKCNWNCNERTCTLNWRVFFPWSLNQAILKVFLSEVVKKDGSSFEFSKIALLGFEQIDVFS